LQPSINSTATGWWMLTSVMDSGQVSEWLN
jgi:hypothetical protein